MQSLVSGRMLQVSELETNGDRVMIIQIAPEWESDRESTSLDFDLLAIFNQAR